MNDDKRHWIEEQLAACVYMNELYPNNKDLQALVVKWSALLSAVNERAAKRQLRRQVRGNV